MNTETDIIESTAEEVVENNQEIATQEDRRVVQVQGFQARDAKPANMIAAAIQSGVSVADLQGMMELQERYEKNEARKAFHKAMTVFREHCPEIKKTKKVEFGHKEGVGKTSYKHADLAGTIDQIKGAMVKAELSHSWRSKVEKGLVYVTCVVTHRLGHSEETTLFAAPDDSGKKNAIQQMASTVTYLERYTLFSLLGLAASEDNDGGSFDDGEVELITEEQAADLSSKIEEVYDTEEKRAKFWKWLTSQTGATKPSELSVKNYQPTLRALDARQKAVNNADD